MEAGIDAEQLVRMYQYFTENDIDLISAAPVFQIDDVFQDMAVIGFFAAKDAVTQANVCGVIFISGFQILLSFDVISACSVEDEALGQCVQIVFYSMDRNLPAG